MLADCTHKIDIYLDCRGIGKILMDDVDITSGVTTVDIHSKPLDSPEITITFSHVDLHFNTDGGVAKVVACTEEDKTLQLAKEIIATWERKGSK